VLDDGSAKDEDRQVRAQNQVALVAMFDFQEAALENKRPHPPVVIATTHLKVSLL